MGFQSGVHVNRIARDEKSSTSGLVEPDHGDAVPGKLQRERKADVAETDDGDFHRLRSQEEPEESRIQNSGAGAIGRVGREFTDED